MTAATCHNLAREAQAERDIQAEILIAITALPGAFFWRSNTGAMRSANGATIRFNRPGTPDILGVWRGVPYGIEVKTATGRQSPEQRKWQSMWERAGGVYTVARSVDDALRAMGLNL